MADYVVEQAPHLGGYIHGGDSWNYAPEVWEHMVHVRGVLSVIDVGCGEGHSTRWFQSMGCTVLGVEGGAKAHAEASLHAPTLLHDYTTGPCPIEDQYDLAWCCEFVEHLEEQFLENFLKTFDHADTILMTHAVIGQPGFHHVNCQPMEYWRDRIEPRGYRLNMPLSLVLRGLTKAANVRNTLLCFEREATLHENYG